MLDIKNQLCPVCKASSHSDLLIEKTGNKVNSYSISLYRCGGCATVFLSNFSTSYNADLYAYYSKYHSMRKSDLYDPITRKSISKILDLLSANGGGSSILDVGCGKGDFVDAALAMGWDAEGIDLSEHAVDIARQYNLPVTKQDFFSSDIQESSRDIVIMSELIEHVPNPGAFLSRAESVLKPGGLLYLTTPNFNSLDRWFLGARWKAIHPEHLIYFTRSTLLAAVQRNTSLEPIHVETRNISQQLINHLKAQRMSSNFRKSHSIESVSSEHSSPIDMRKTIDSSPLLKLLKKVANSFLNTTSSGSTIVVLLKKLA